MKNICENEIQEEIIELLEENCSITMKEMAENALTGLNMATKKSVEEIMNEEGKYKHLISAFIITQRIMGK